MRILGNRQFFAATLDFKNTEHAYMRYREKAFVEKGGGTNLVATSVHKQPA